LLVPILKQERSIARGVLEKSRKKKNPTAIIANAVGSEV
jgi:hypothetical protein